VSLDRFREATLSRARSAAEESISEVRAEAEARKAACAAEATQLVAQARSDGQDSASRELVADERLTRRRARETVLAARRDLYERVRREAVESLLARQGSDEYARLIGALQSRATEQLGAEVRCSEPPSGQGGLIAEAEGRRVTYSLDALVDDELRRRGIEIESLWA